jgi:DnaK suppressor protein
MDTPGMIKTRLLLKKAEIEARYAVAHIREKDRPRENVPNSESSKKAEKDEAFYSPQQEALAELAQINLALKRLEEGEYTKCSSCGLPIPDRMLKAFPTATLCFNCECKT